jgi:hypothetical protein
MRPLDYASWRRLRSAWRCQYRNTKHRRLMFRAILGDSGGREVRFSATLGEAPEVEVVLV